MKRIRLQDMIELFKEVLFALISQCMNYFVPMIVGSINSYDDEDSNQRINCKSMDKLFIGLLRTSFIISYIQIDIGTYYFTVTSVLYYYYLIILLANIAVWN